MKLRDYQSEAIEALYKGWADGGRRLAVVLPTGVGKTVIMTTIAADAAHHGRRALILVHRDELAQQTLDKLRQMVRPGVTVGLVKAEHDEHAADIVVASIQTVQRLPRLERIWSEAGPLSVVIADEIHRSASQSWVSVFEALGCLPGDQQGAPLLCGFTATLSRADARGLGDIWERVVYTRGIKWFIEHGHLVEPRGKTVVTDLNLTEVKKTGGDYNEHELGIRMADETIREAIISAYREHADGRLGVLFAPTVASAEFFAEGLSDAGLRTEGVYGTTPLSQRAEIYARYRAGETRVLTSCTALAEGWDAPWASCAVLARPTLHAGLYIQQVGRVLRPWPGKKDAIILDVAGAAQRHSLHALIELNETIPQDVNLTEVKEVDEEEIKDLEATRYRGPVAFADVDLFAGTGAKWLTTTGGVLFIPTSDKLVFLHPQPDGWAIGVCPKTHLHGGSWVAQGLSPEEALAEASEYAIMRDPTIASIHAPWRKRGKPSDKQIDFARNLGIDSQGMGKAELSDAITMRLASRTLRTLATTK